MKLYLPLALFLLAVSTAAQTLVGLQPNTTAWSVTNVTFNPYLGHEYEGCWPNGTLSFSTNQSGSFFTASEWTGPACEDYDLIGGEIFYIGNGSQYGYLDSNDSIQFNYNRINSSIILLNLWYGCDGDQYCDTTADVILSIENPSVCIFNTELYTLNMCPLSSSFSGSVGGPYSLFNYSVSLLSNNVTSCDGSQNVWATFSDFNGCHDIATQVPNYTLQTSDGSESQGSLAILFPVQQSSNSSTQFQLSITLICNFSAINTTLSLSNLYADLKSNLTTISLIGSSPSVCPQSIECSAVALGGSDYNLCLLQQSNLTFFNISDQVFGELSFNFGNRPLIPNCPGQNGSVFATYTTLNGCSTLSTNPLTYYDGNGGNIVVGFPQTNFNDIVVTVVIQLQCDASQVSAFEFSSPVSTSVEMYSSLFLSLILQGTSPSACPISNETLNA